MAAKKRGRSSSATKLLLAKPKTGCQKCGMAKGKFPTEARRRSHVRFCDGAAEEAKPRTKAKRTPKKKGKISCPHCKETFKRSQDRGNHIKKEHPTKFVPREKPGARAKAPKKRATKGGRDQRGNTMSEARLKEVCKGVLAKLKKKKLINQADLAQKIRAINEEMPNIKPHHRLRLIYRMALDMLESIGEDVSRGIRKPGKRPKRKKEVRKMGNGDPERTLPGKAFDTKDVVRGGLHGLAMLYLRGAIPKRSRAICLPGMRPDHERELFGDFRDVLMVENNGKVARKVKDARIVKGDFIDVLIDEGIPKPFSMVDFDLCGRPTYREGSIFTQMNEIGVVTKRFCLRITFCTRSSKGSVKEDLDQMDNDIRDRYDVLSYVAMPYRNPKGTTMEIRQWVLEGRN